MEIGVIGCGRWGSFLAWYAARNHRVTIYGRADSARFCDLRKTRKNGYVTLPESVAFTDDLAAVLGADLILVSVAAQHLRELCLDIKKTDAHHGKTLVLCMKGIEKKSGLRLTEVVADVLGNDVHTAIWVGPGHPQDFTAGVPNCMVIDSAEEDVKRRVVAALQGDLIRFYRGTDIIGNEIGAAAKNIIGIAAGLLDGMGKTALKGALMSRGTREIARLIAALGGEELSAYGLAHLGDYEATVFSPYSHNRRYGELLAKGEPYGELAEGAESVDAVCMLGEKVGVELPICRAVKAIIDGDITPADAMGELFLRSLKDEF